MAWVILFKILKNGQQPYLKPHRMDFFFALLLNGLKVSAVANEIMAALVRSQRSCGYRFQEFIGTYVCIWKHIQSYCHLLVCMFAYT